MKKLFLIVFAAMLASTAYAHSGGTDSNNCHRDHKTGGYHCH